MASRLSSILRFVIPLAGVAIFFAPAPEGYTPVVVRTAGLVVFTIGLWATQALPEHVTGLLFLLSAVLAQVVPANVVFSGFTSATLWLVLGGLIIAEAVRSTGLGERLALALLGRFLQSYPRLVAAVVVVATLLCFVMPATLGRVLLLLPIVAAIAQRIGFERGSTGYMGLLLAAMVATFQVGTGVLPANAPNLALAGAAESLYGIHINYGEYLLVQFPVLGLMKMAVIVAVTWRIFPAVSKLREERRRASRLRPEERKLAVILGIALAFWATDVWHGIAPGWIALAAGLATLLPRIGVMPVTVFNDRVRFGPYFYMGAVLGLGAVVTSTGLSTALGTLVLPLLGLEPGADFRNFLVLALAATVACMGTTNPAQPGLMAPLAEQIAAITGWPLNAALMVSAIGYSNIVLPYAVPPLVVGMQIAGIGFRHAARYTLALALPGFLILAPLDFLWWKAIGYFG